MACSVRVRACAYIFPKIGNSICCSCHLPARFGLDQLDTSLSPPALNLPTPVACFRLFWNVQLEGKDLFFKLGLLTAPMVRRIIGGTGQLELETILLPTAVYPFVLRYQRDNINPGVCFSSCRPAVEVILSGATSRPPPPTIL